MQKLVEKMMDYCESSCEKENGKISVAFSYCYLERVLLKKRSLHQELVRYYFKKETYFLHISNDVILLSFRLIIKYKGLIFNFSRRWRLHNSRNSKRSKLTLIINFFFYSNVILFIFILNVI